MEDKQENNLQIDDLKSSVGEKIIEFIVFYLTSNIFQKNTYENEYMHIFCEY